MFEFYNRVFNDFKNVGRNIGMVVGVALVIFVITISVLAPVNQQQEADLLKVISVARSESSLITFCAELYAKMARKTNTI